MTLYTINKIQYTTAGTEIDYLVVLKPVEAVRAQDKPVFSRGAFDQRNRYAEPAFPDELVSGSPSPCPAIPFRGPVKPDEIGMVGVHVGQLNFQHQLQLPNQRKTRF